MSELGVLECFFGPPWTMAQRIKWADLLQKYSLDFYIYAPKADGNLRKHWREEWNPSYISELKALSACYRNKQKKFGVGLSPFGYESKDQNILREKLALLDEIGVDYLGIFFDDMKYSEGMLKDQLHTLEIVSLHSKSKILFCPSYYTFDPILDKVFGQRPANYLEDIGREVPREMEILWTGPKVISPEISAEHLHGVSEILKRKPFLCDNFFANDGPKQCKFLKLKPSAGRSPAAFQESSGWAFNPMNQSALSQIVVLGAKFEFTGKTDSLQNALRELCSKPLANYILDEVGLKQNLDELTETQKMEMTKNLKEFQEDAAIEICDWLAGKYTVGSECLTD